MSFGLFSSIRRNKMKMTVYEKVSVMAARDALKGVKSTKSMIDEDFDLYLICYNYWIKNLDLAERVAR